MSLHFFGGLERSVNSQDAVTAFRGFLLRLALRGGLVPRNLADGDARVLLHQGSGDPEIEVAALGDFGEFEVPPHWVWVRVRDIGRVVGGGTPPSGDADCFSAPGSDIPWLTPADLGHQRSRTYVSRGRRDITPRGLSCSGATLMPAGTVLFTSRAPIGYVAIAETQLTTNQGFKSIIPSAVVISGYVALYFRAFGPLIDSLAPGTTFREVSGKIVAGLPFPLPPLKEQHRIVAKVDALMALCDELEAAQTNREARRDRLRTTSLRDLVAPDESKQNARFFLRHSARMITKPEHVAGARQAILDLAVRGRLVAQDPGDETAAGPAISLNGHGANTSDDSIDSILPSAWIWSNLASVVYMENGDRSKNYPSKEHRVTSGVPFVNAGNLCDDRISESDLDYISEERLSLLRAGKFARDDILFCLRGSLGKVARVSNLDRGAIASSLIILRAGPAVHVTYLHLFLKSGLVAEQIREFDNGTAQPNLAGKDLGRFRVPLPPLAEQHRIVAKVDELMAVCDGLKQSLAAEQTERGRLLEALLHDALEDALPARELEPLGAR